MSKRPYLSVVATSRNDDHGGDPLYRTQLFVSGLIAQSDRFKVSTELVLVEWNPPADRPRLAEVLEWPAGEGWCDVRIIEVPPEEHARLEYSDRLPLYQMIGKNVGIRRARGEFVVATNIDVLFSDGLMRFLAGRGLKHGFVYRNDRIDVPAELDRNWPIERQLAFCSSSAIRVNRREGTLDLRDGVFYRIYPHNSLGSWLRNAPSGRKLAESRLGRAVGIHALAHIRPIPHEGVYGYLVDGSRFGVAAAARAIRTALATIRFALWRAYVFAYWIVAGFNSPRLVPQRIKRLVTRIVANTAPDADAGTPGSPETHSNRAHHPGRLPLLIATGITTFAARKLEALKVVWDAEVARVPLHTNASGDFTLMSLEDWSTTHGYAELQMYSMHIDGLHLYVSHYLDIRERFLPFPIYHIDHTGGFRPEAKGADALDATLARRAIPQITNDQLLAYIHDMYRSRRPVPFNGDDWGLVDVELPETSPTRTAAIGLAGAATEGERMSRDVRTVAVVGLGKLGAPMVACLASKGFDVVGVDVDNAKVEAIAAGRAPVFEPGLDALLAGNGARITATTDIHAAVRRADVTFVVVATPSDDDGTFSLRFVLPVCESIGEALRESAERHTVVMTSTVMPGATAGPITEAIERTSGKTCGVDFGLCYSPEFIALGSVIRDFLNPDFLLVGESDEAAGATLSAIYRRVCGDTPPIARMNFVNAELAKISVNTFVTTKIAFANMLARICERLPEGDVDTVTAAIGLDSRIGIRYLRGAIGYGGPCFPRDNVAFATLARTLKAPALIAEATDRSNRGDVRQLVDLVREKLPNHGAVSILGVSYKPNTDVVEESAALHLADELAEVGFDVIVYDPAGMESAKQVLGDRVTFARSAEDAASQGDVVVVATPWDEIVSLPASVYTREGRQRIVIDCWRALSRAEISAVADYVALGEGRTTTVGLTASEFAASKQP